MAGARVCNLGHVRPIPISRGPWSLDGGGGVEQREATEAAVSLVARGAAEAMTCNSFLLP